MRGTVSTHQDAIRRALRERAADERRRRREMAQDVLAVVVGHGDVQRAQRICRRELRRVLDGGHDVCDSELFQLLHVFGSREAGQVEARRDLAGHPLV